MNNLIAVLVNYKPKSHNSRLVIKLPFDLQGALCGIRVTGMATEEDREAAALITQVRVELAERGMQQKDLAAAMGIEPATLNRYLKSKRGISMSVFFKMASGLGMTKRELMQKIEQRLEQ